MTTEAPQPVGLNAAQLSEHVGQELGASSWHTVTQEQIERFGEATWDRQWIHIDPERAKQGPFGTTVAHGYLTLSLGPALLQEIVRVDDAALVVNYGLERVRFPAPVPAGSSVRAVAVCEEVTEVSGGFQVRLGVTFERAGEAKPACVAQVLFRYYH